MIPPPTGCQSQAIERGLRLGRRHSEKVCWEFTSDFVGVEASDDSSAAGKILRKQLRAMAKEQEMTQRQRTMAKL